MFFLLHRANRAVLAHANAILVDELGVSSAQLGALYYVAKHPGCSMTDIADVIDLNKSAASGIVQRLERAEVLRREAHPKDGRSTQLFLTKKGETVRVQSLAIVRRLTTNLTEGFDEAEMETVFRFLNVVVARCADIEIGSES